MSTREAIGWGLLFGIPPGLGVTGYASMLMGGRLIEPLAAGIGLLTALVIFTVVYGAQQMGSAEPAAVRERID